MTGQEAPPPRRPGDSITYVGINIGALSVKVVGLRGDDDFCSQVVTHQGRPLEVLERVLAAPEFAGDRFVGVSGHLGRIPEAAAIQRALGHLALAAMLLPRFRKLDAESIPSVKLYYKHIWDNFYLEYILYTLI